MAKVVPESCETCQLERSCNLRKHIIKNGVDKCQAYRMSDDVLVCKSCSNITCFNFGACLPVQEILLFI